MVLGEREVEHWLKWLKLTKRKYRVTIFAATLCNNILNKEDKLFKNPAIFKATTKSM